MKPTTNRESMDGKLVANSVEGFEHGAGAFWYEDDGEDFCGLTPGHHLVRCPVDMWTRTGSPEQPTLTPSILTSITWGLEREYIELWHGFMRAGRWESC